MYVPDQTYHYLLIGNFFDDAHTTVWQTPGPYCLPYYYVDDICVTENPQGCEFTVSSNPSITKLNIEISPNPFYHRAIVSFNNDNDIFSMELYNISGNMVRSINNISSGSFEIIRGDLKSGLYIMKLYSSKTKPITTKILII
ncbi:MAG: hypothetical protein Kow0068_09480 [Marinilabiliales bacterium]